MFLIDTNSLRSCSAQTTINQIENLIHLNNKDSINIVAYFPCLKLSTSFSSPSSLTYNIHSYDTQLFELSNILNFTVANLGLHEQHLSSDKIHINSKHQHLVQDGILNYFEQLTPVPPSLLLSPRLNRRCEAAVLEGLLLF
ncbi:unnamed protein product [Adineta steineri]|uniref:Uncharacterized protein n=1 Tax=Adineta steineri TaxID=433720 RepID=A0A815BST6_9BILA|nr:unnamed protein product [Adineta steineri]CAF4124071.1 unnamed protein product [Adineta steineri]